jgi:uncharacterized membrane protein
VLTSRWSRVLGVPVGLPAAALYVSIAAAAMVAAGSTRETRRRTASRALWCAAGAIPAVVGWFVALQWFDLGVICRWCLASHALGLLTAVGALVMEVRAGRLRPLPFAGGVGLACMFALAQVALPSAGPAPVPLSEDQASLLEDRLPRTLNEAPRLGGESSQQVALLFDYCCPHCRQTHALLVEALSDSPGAFALVLLPTPLSSECNPHVEETEARFLDACDLARLSLAVWRADRARFAEYDAWLFATESARSAAEARTAAERLVGADALARALQDPWIDALIRANVEAFAASEVDAIPVLIAPGRGGVSGRVSSRDALDEALQQGLGVALPQ